MLIVRAKNRHPFDQQLNKDTGISSWEWFTFCWVPVIPLGKKHKDVSCTNAGLLCKRADSYRLHARYADLDKICEIDPTFSHSKAGEEAQCHRRVVKARPLKGGNKVRHRRKDSSHSISDTNNAIATSVQHITERHPIRRTYRLSGYSVNSARFECVTWLFI